MRTLLILSAILISTSTFAAAQRSEADGVANEVISDKAQSISDNDSACNNLPIWEPLPSDIVDACQRQLQCIEVLRDRVTRYCKSFWSGLPYSSCKIAKQQLSELEHEYALYCHQNP